MVSSRGRGSGGRGGGYLGRSQAHSGSLLVLNLAIKCVRVWLKKCIKCLLSTCGPRLPSVVMLIGAQSVCPSNFIST